MDKKQLSQLDPKLKAVYDRVMGIANTAPPPPLPVDPMIQAATQIPAPFPIQPPTPQAQLNTIAPPPSPLSGIPSTAPSPMPASLPLPDLPEVPTENTSPAIPPPPPAPSATESIPAINYTSGTDPIPTSGSNQPAMQTMQSTIPVPQPQQPLVHTQGTGKSFMIVFIILGVIFFALYAVFWVQLFHLGIPPFS